MKRLIALTTFLLPLCAAAQQALVQTSSPTNLSNGQFNPLIEDTSGNLRVTGSLTPSGTQHVDGTGVAGTPAGGVLSVQGVAGGTSVPISAASLPLPTSAATDASLTNGNLKSTAGVELLDSGGTNKASISAAGAVKVDGSAATQPISVASLPLPASAATAANQLNNGATYSVGGNGYTAYATPQDMLCVTGSGTKTVYITRLTINIQSTAAALQTVFFIKRSTANSGGTSTNPALIPYDSTNAAATATITLYTATPTPGTSLGNLRAQEQASSTLAVTPPVIDLYTATTLGTSVSLTQPVTLRGTAESVCANYAGAALTAGFTAAYMVEVVEK